MDCVPPPLAPSHPRTHSVIHHSIPFTVDNSVPSTIDPPPFTRSPCQSLPTHTRTAEPDHHRARWRPYTIPHIPYSHIPIFPFPPPRSHPIIPVFESPASPSRAPAARSPWPAARELRPSAHQRDGMMGDRLVDRSSRRRRRRLPGYRDCLASRTVTIATDDSKLKLEARSSKPRAARVLECQAAPRTPHTAHEPRYTYIQGPRTAKSQILRLRERAPSGCSLQTKELYFPRRHEDA